MTATNEEILESFKLNVLDENRAFLCQNLTPKDHYPYLRSRHILSEDDEELIELQQLRKQKVHKFLDLLIKRGPHGYDELVKSLLLERTQVFVVEQLNKAYEEKRKRFYALLNSQPQVVHCPPISNGVTSSHLNRKEKMQMQSVSGSNQGKLSEPISFKSLSVPVNSLPIPVLHSDQKVRTLMDSADEKKQLDTLKSLCGPKSVDENDENSSFDGSQGYKESLA